MNSIEQEQKGLPSASEMHRVYACPGYLSAKAVWQKRKKLTDEAAKMGQDIHEALADTMLEFEVDGESYAFNDLSARAQWVSERCSAIREALSAEFIGAQGPLKRWVENRWFMVNRGVEVATAKPDVVEVNNTKCWLIMDYKSGPKPVPDATVNWQIATAAACILNDEESLQKYDMDAVYGAIIQPLVTSTPKVVKYSIDDIRDLRAQILRACRQASMKHQPRLPGDHCDFCPVSHICPETMAFLPVYAKRSANLEHLTPGQLNILHSMVSFVRKRCDELTDYIKCKLEEEPGSIPGLRLEDREAGYKITDAIKTLKAVTPVIDKSEFWKMARIPTGELRDMWVNRVSETQGITKKAALALYKDQIEPTMEKKPSVKIIKREDTNG